MKELKISIYKRNASDPDTAVRIPLTSLKVMDALIPKNVRERMVDEGIDLQEILKATETKKASGKLMKIQEKDEHVVIPVE
ncbi:MAG: hypothetical protein ACE5K0_03155 [Candidatus Methanofastidiosia archaeon]